MNFAELDNIIQKILREIKQLNNKEKPVKTEEDVRKHLRMLVDMTLYYHSQMSREITIDQDSNIWKTIVYIGCYEYGFHATGENGSFKFGFCTR